jgi:hypothetical protein
MTEEQIDPKAVEQLADWAPDETQPESWVDRHWFALLGLTLIFVWASIIWLLTLIPHNPTH